METRKKQLYYNPKSGRTQGFTERVINSRWFQASGWIPQEPETPPSLEKEVKLEDEIKIEDETQEEKEEVVVQDVVQELKEGVIDLEALSDEELSEKYEEKFDKKPHHKLKREKIIERLS